MRKLILLALGGAAARYVIRNRGQQASPSVAADDYAPTDTATPRPRPSSEAATADTVETEAVVPDASADDPLVREQEEAAAAQAGAIGGHADPLPVDVDPEMRPVVEGSGDAAETFEQTEDQGR